MPNLTRVAVRFAVCSLLATGVAHAGVPDPANSECSAPFIRVVGHDGVVADPAGLFCVTYRDFNNLPIPNAPIEIDFSRCGVQLCADQLDPDVTVNCATQRVSKISDANGVACFRVIGRSRPGLGCTPVAFPWCAEVFAGGEFICGLIVPTFDLDVVPGVGGNDISEFLSIFFNCTTYMPRIDYDGNAEISGLDFSILLGDFFSGASAVNCPALCP